MKPGFSRWLLVPLALIAVAQLSAGAAEQRSDAKTSQVEGQPAEPATEPAAEPAGPTPEVFDPSENISEDFAVAFPVDI